MAPEGLVVVVLLIVLVIVVALTAVCAVYQMRHYRNYITTFSGGIDTPSASPTYIVRSDLRLPKHYRPMFAAAGFVPWTRQISAAPTCVYEDGDYMYSRNTWRQPSDIKSVLGSSKTQLTDKAQLYETLKDTNWVPKQYTFDRGDLAPLAGVFDGRRFLLKPTGQHASKSRGVIVVETKAELQKALADDFNKTRGRFVLAEYVERPLLAGGRKFHTRVLALAATDQQIVIFDDLIYSWLSTAPYSDGSLEALVTNTDGQRLRWDEHASVFSSDTVAALNEIVKPKLIKAVKDAFAAVVFEPYPENKEAFELIGFDFLITDDFEVFIAEINAKPGFGSLEAKYPRLFEGIANTAKRLNDKIQFAKNIA